MGSAGLESAGDRILQKPGSHILRSMEIHAADRGSAGARGRSELKVPSFSAACSRTFQAQRKPGKLALQPLRKSRHRVSPIGSLDLESGAVPHRQKENGAFAFSVGNKEPRDIVVDKGSAGG